MFLFCVQFTNKRRPFYSWLKRRFPSLQSIESEQRVTLDVYRLEEYVAKLKYDASCLEAADNGQSLKRTISMGSVEAIHEVEIDDLECSICLEKI